MKYSIWFLLLFILESHGLFAQQIIWQNTITGNNYDNISSVHATMDGGVICIAASTSGDNQDKSDPCIGWNDFWIIKLDISGAIEWNVTIGGDTIDNPSVIIQASNGDYFCAGTSFSGISGNKTEPGFGFEDFWVLKLDASGAIIWQNTIGGDSLDELHDLIVTPDGGVLCGGTSKSGISGDKTEAAIGEEDYWLVKLDSQGAVQWQNTIGGSARDWINSLALTQDGGYICGGYSNSTISGDKTENPMGAGDYWIVKLNAAGNIEWDKTIGANLHDELFKIMPTADGGFVCGGESNSLISGHKSETRDAYDYWIVKLDSTGQLLWENTIRAGNGSLYSYDYLRDMVPAADGGIICGGYSHSWKGQDKSEPTNGDYDYWIIKLDQFGNVLWQNTIGGDRNDYFTSMDITNQGELFVAGYSDSGISGDKTEHSSWMSDDGWVLKLNTIFNQVSGKVYHDTNANGVYDPLEYPIPYRKIFETGSGVFSYTDFDGDYIIQIPDSGILNIQPLLENIYFNPVPAQHSILFSTFNNIETSRDFAFQNSGVYNDLCIEATPSGPFRPGFTGSYIIEFNNEGTTSQNATVIFYPDSGLTYSSSTPSPISITQDSLVFDMGTLDPFQHGYIWINFSIDPAIPISSTLSSNALIIPVSNDFNPACNQDTASCIVTGAYDPNDISVNRRFLYDTEVAANQTFLEYTIRFQNTGNDTAFTIKIENKIPEELNLTYFELINSSHSCQTSYSSYDSIMRFIFYDILLPDSNVNEPMSHGFVKYRVKPNITLNPGDTIQSTAAIVFDYNLPVHTNTAITEIIIPTYIVENEDNFKIQLFPNPANNELNIGLYNNAAKISLIEIYNVYGQKVRAKDFGSTKKDNTTFKLDISDLAPGIYFIKAGEEMNLVDKFVKY